MPAGTRSAQSTNKSNDMTDEPDLEALFCPALLVDARLRVHRRNRAAAAALAVHDVMVTVVDGCLHLRGAEAGRKVKRGIGAVLDGSSGTLGLALRRDKRLPVTLRIAATALPGLAQVEIGDPHCTQLDIALLQDLFGLTPAEAIVAAMVCDGQSSADIAAELHVKPGTVDAHLKRVLTKCEVQRRPQMVALLLKSVAVRRGHAPPRRRGGRGGS